MVISLGKMATPERLKEIQNMWITSFGSERRIPVSIQIDIVDAIKQEGAVSVGEILRRYAKNDKELAYLRRTLLYLMKFDILS